MRYEAGSYTPDDSTVSERFSDVWDTADIGAVDHENPKPGDILSPDFQ